eukprot:Em0002g733a
MALRRVRTGYMYALVLTAAFACGEGQCPSPVPSPIVTSLAAFTQINTEARLHCEFSCPNVYPTWEKRLSSNWMSIRDNNSISGYYIATNGDLYVPQADDCTAGTYRCVASIIGSPTPLYSNNVTITVLRNPVLQLCNMQSNTICVDPVQRSRNVCVTIEGNPNVNWTLDRLEGSQKETKQIKLPQPPVFAAASQLCPSQTNKTMAQLTISLDSPISISSGSYVLTANYLSGESKNLSLNINISGPDNPYPTTSSTVVLLNYSQSISIPCTVQPSALQGVGCGGLSINAGMSITWTKEGVEVPQDHSEPVYTTNTSNSSILIIQALQKHQTGQYICQASNIKGSNTFSTNVYGPPDPVLGLTFSVTLGTVTLGWKPATSSPITVIYRVYYGKVNGSQTSIITSMQTVDITELPEGNYEAYVLAIASVSSATAPSLPSTTVFFTVNPSGLSQATSITIGVSTGGVIISVILMTIGVFLLLKYYSFKKMNKSVERSWMGEDDIDHHTLAVNEYVTPITLNQSNGTSTKLQCSNRMSMFEDLDPKWEFPRELLQFSEILHDGYSTVLFKGSATGIKGDKQIDVAVKTCKEGYSEDDVKAFIADMEFLASLGSHPNIIGLLRVCTVESPMCMVLEYMCHGDLLGFLRASRGHHGLYTVFPGKREQLPSLNLTSRDIINIATKISSGMMFLETKKAVHGLLCASNVLVGTSLDIKINVGGYDLNRENFIKWMAPETLFDGTSNTLSDVWSFGVTMWELITVGGTPYAEILPFDVYSQLCGGMRLPKPMHCAQEVYDIVKICWAKVPTERPSFVVLHERLDAMTQSKMSFLDFQLYSDEAYSQFEDDSQLSTPL